MLFGYVVHLLLDELYSLNLFGSRSKRSLGTAFKFWTPHSGAATLAVYLLCLAAFVLAPDPRPVLAHLTAHVFSADSTTRWWPEHGWFASRAGESPWWTLGQTLLPARLDALLVRMGALEAADP